MHVLLQRSISYRGQGVALRGNKGEMGKKERIVLKKCYNKSFTQFGQQTTIAKF